MGVAVPVLYQRPDGSAHVINAVHTASKDPAGRDVVVLWDPQRGEEAEVADVSAVTGMWVIPVPEAEPEPAGMVVLPSSGSGLRSQGWGSGLPTEVAGPKRQPGAFGSAAGKTGPKGTKRTQAETGESSGGRSGGRWQQPLLGLPPRVQAMRRVGCSPRPINQYSRMSGRRNGNRKRRKRTQAPGEKGCRRPGCGVGGVGGAGELTEEQAGELAELQPKVAQQKQQSKEKNAKQYQARKAAAARVVVLEELEGRGS
ncbi:hypothetical protein [Saccharopolyspora spinosa]|uniref:hypothetical protein n=1 Tax=Saccharopolyspora spinosa TaxID=60894 RepID=UPI00376EA478